MQLFRQPPMPANTIYEWKASRASRVMVISVPAIQRVFKSIAISSLVIAVLIKLCSVERLYFLAQGPAIHYNS
jgi:hypothetical protein